MPDEPRTEGGWLPPAAPGGNPPPRFDAPAQPAWTPPASAPAAASAPALPAPGRPAFIQAAPLERNPTAVWALALGIGALTILMLSVGTLFLLTLPCSAAAWVLAVRARRRADASETHAGEGQAVAALWLGRIGVIAGVAAGVVLIVLIASGFDFEQLRDDLERELERQEREDGGGVRTAIEHLRATIGR